MNVIGFWNHNVWHVLMNLSHRNKVETYPDISTVLVDVFLVTFTAINTMYYTILFSLLGFVFGANQQGL